MRTTILALLAVALTTAFPAGGWGAARIVHHDLELRLDPGSGSLAAVDRLTVAVATRDSGPLVLLLSPAVEVTALAIDGSPSPYSLSNGRLTSPLPAGKKATVEVRIAYRGIFADAAPRDPVNTEDPSYGVAAAITPEGSLLLAEAGWYPDIPGSQPTFRLAVEGPAGYQAVTAGRRLEHRQEGTLSRSLWQIDHPLRGLALAAGPYLVRETMAGEIPVYTYFHPDQDHLAAAYLEAAVRYLELYRARFGPYPFAKFAIVENFFPTGYGFPSWTLIGSRVLALPFIIDTSLGHEIAHSWWGNGVWVDGGGGNWSEGLTTYVADHLFKELESAAAARDYRLKILRDYTTLVSPAEDYPLTRFTSRRSAEDQAIGYGKTAMVFHMLRRLLGDRPFWDGLRRLAAERLFQPTGWSELEAVFSAAAGGRDLAPFFRQWVERAGAPRLMLEEVADTGDGKGWTVTGRVAQQGEIFDLQVPLQLELAAGIDTRTVSLEGRKGSFHFAVPAPPLRLVGDPDVDLFRRLAPEELPPTVNGIKGSEELVVVDAGTLSPPVLQEAKVLLEALGQPQASIALADLDDPAPAGRDLLYLGIPRDPGFLPPLPGELTLEATGFTLFGTRFTAPEDALFVALPHPRDPEHQVGVFLPLSAAAAARAARKIPHYGKYSYLVLTSAGTPIKGTWPVIASPLVHEFRQPHAPDAP